MNTLKTLAFGVLALALSACSSTEVVSRNATLQPPELTVQAKQPILRDYNIHSIRFAVPADLKVSEANTYYPIADIVWRGDPLGNRPEQITQIFETAILDAGTQLDGARDITVDVQLARFHSLTERTRYSVGGVHSIKFDLTVRDAHTGEILEPSRRINADLPGLGGTAAVAAEFQGQGQKERITNHLTRLFVDELTGITGPAAPTQTPAPTPAQTAALTPVPNLANGQAAL